MTLNDSHQTTGERDADTEYLTGIRRAKTLINHQQDCLDQEVKQLQNRCQHQWKDVGELQIQCIYCDLVDFDQ